MVTEKTKPSKYEKYKNTYTTYQNCECGGKFNLNSKHNHLNSGKHKKYIELNKQKDKIIEEQNKKIEELTTKLNNIKEITK